MKPMLARRADTLAEIPLPSLITPKLDGIRCVTHGGTALSRAWKPIPNAHIQRMLSTLPHGLDGELMVPGSFGDVQSAVMSRDGEPPFTYHVFDRRGLDTRYIDRIWHVAELSLPDFCQPVMPMECATLEALEQLASSWLADGYEGIIARDAASPYVYGRSLAMLKWKPYADSEAVIVGFKEQLQNLNPAVPNAYGYASRPGGRGLSAPKGTLGGLLVRDVHTGVEFQIGTGKGLNDELRLAIWNDQSVYLGRIVRYTYQECGTDERPRFPSFQGFRHPEDMS